MDIDKRKLLKQSDIVWSAVPNESDTAESFHGYYAAERVGGIGIYTGEKHNGNSSLCNHKYGISEDGDTFVAIELVESTPLVADHACKRCLKIFKNLDN